MRAPAPGSVCVAARLGQGRGFTLIEVMIAITVLSVGALALMSSHVACASLEKVNRETAMAVNEARRIIEEIRMTPYADLDDCNGRCFDVSQGECTLTGLSSGERCGSVMVSDEDVSGTREILVTVEWRSISGQERRIQLACRVSDHL